MTGADDHDEENVMRRRRSRNRSETASPALAFGKLPRLLLLLVVLLPIAEWSASAIMARLDSRAKAVTLSDDDIVKLYGTDQPAQYREALAEMPQAHDGTYAPLTEYRMPARQGRHLTIDGQGIRGGVMGADGPRVVVFGGSTAFGHGLTDGETIAAIMAAKLAQDGRPARVENRATPGWYSTQDRIAFAEMLATGDKPDVAVFIHGVDDFLSCGKPERTAWSDRLARVGIPAGLETVVRQSALAALVRRLTGMAEPSGPVAHNPACASDAQAEASLARLDANRRLIAAMAERFGVKPVFVQQPVPTHHYDNAKRAVPVEPHLMVPYVPVAKGYARLAEMRGTGKLWEQDLLWLAELEPGEANAYIDPVHYAPAFARLIGETLARRVGDLLPATAFDGASPAVNPPAVQ